MNVVRKKKLKCKKRYQSIGGRIEGCGIKISFIVNEIKRVHELIEMSLYKASTKNVG